MSEIVYVKALESGERIDALLARYMDSLTRSQAQRLIEAGAVTLGGAEVKKNRKSAAGETYRVELPEPAEIPLTAQDIPLDVVYEDADVVVVNKPRGMVVHPAPGAPGRHARERAHVPLRREPLRHRRRAPPGIVHRIDKDTSGLIIAAKNDFAHLALSEQLADHSLARVYECVVRGRMRETRARWTRP